MKYLGTKSGVLDLPKQLRVDPDLGSAVRFISSANCRSIQGQILFWINEGVEKEEKRLRRRPSEKVTSGPGPKSVNVRNSQERAS